MTTQNTDMTTLDLDTLVDWYIQLRDYKSQLKRSIEPQEAEATMTMERIEAEMNRRCMAMGANAMKTAHGSITRAKKQKYVVSDPYTFRQWVMNNPETASQIMPASITQGELSAFLDSGGTMPDGIDVEEKWAMSVRRSKG